MSKENKFHKFIERLDQEEKNRAWEKITAEENVRLAEESAPVRKPVKRFAWRKLVAACAAVLLVAAGIFTAMRFLPQDKTADGGNWGSASTDLGEEKPETSEDNRYCDTNSYESSIAEKTFKDAGFLYLEWYDITDYCETVVYQMKDSGETLGYCERIMDVNTGSLVSVHAICEGYTLKELDFYDDGVNTENVGGIEIRWGSAIGYSYANFAHGGYDYFVIVEYPTSDDSVLEILNELLV